MFEKYSNSFLKDFTFESILGKFEKKFFRNFAQNEFIYHKDELVKNIHFIISGEIHLISSESEIIDYKLRSLNGDDILGIDDAITGNCHSNSAYAAKCSNVLSVCSKEFMNITNNNDELNFWILKYLSSGNVHFTLE